MIEDSRDTPCTPWARRYEACLTNIIIQWISSALNQASQQSVKDQVSMCKALVDLHTYRGCSHLNVCYPRLQIGSAEYEVAANLP